MNMRPTYRTALFLTLAHGQLSSPAQEIACLDLPRAGALITGPGRDGDHQARPITDDRNGNERTPITQEIIVVHHAATDATLTLDILNEEGHVVRHHVLEPSRGQRFWSIDVRSLDTGHYVARVLCAKGAVVNHFRRD